MIPSDIASVTEKIRFKTRLGAKIALDLPYNGVGSTKKGPDSFRKDFSTMIRHFLKLGLASLAAMALSSPLMAQTQVKKHLAEEHDESSSMPPAPPIFPITTPGMVVPMDGYISYQVNVNAQGQNIVGDAANEPSFVIDPTNPLRMAVGWRQFNNVSSNFRQAGYAYSLDGGVHWTFPGVLENNVFRSDPVLDTSSNGVFQYNSLLQTFFTTEWRSNNQGQNWTMLGPATGGDKNWITVDKTNSSGAGFVYQIWSTAGNNYGGRQFSRSTDGGTTWMNPINLPSSPVWGTLDVGQNGELYIVGTDGSQPSMRYLRSSNAKNSAQTPTFDQSIFVDLGGDLSYGTAVNPDGLAGQAWIAADRGANSPFRGNIYIMASVDPNGTQSRVDVKLRRSINGGSTWQPAMTVNDDGSVNGRFHWMSSLSVAPNGRVDVCWLDTRHDASAQTSRLYYTYSTDGGATFAPNIAVSPAFNSLIGWPQQNKIGDYMQMISDNGGANIVYPATFTGGQDVYFVRVPQSVAQTVNPSTFSLFRGQLVSGQLSDLFNVDANYVTAKAGLTLNGSEAPLQYVIEGTAPSSTATALSFTCVSKASATALQQEISLFNFQTNAYELVDTRLTTLADQTVTYNATGSLGRFIGSGNAIRARVAVRQVGPVATQWTHSLNQTVWSVTP